MAQRTFEGLKGGEHRTAFARGVRVFEHEPWHEFSIPDPAAADIGATPWLRNLS